MTEHAPVLTEHAPLPHWHVLGAGSIGCLFAHALHQHGHNVSLILKQCSAAKALVTIESADQAPQTVQLRAETATDTTPIQHLLVTTKSYDVLAAVESVSARLHSGSQILLLINGMGLAEQLQAALPNVEIFCGSTTVGAYQLAPRHVVQAGKGDTRVGRIRSANTTQAKPPAWFEHWQASIENCQWEAQIEQVLWYKLAINCAINPLTALNDCRNGELATRPELSNQVKMLCDEIVQISYAAGFTSTAQTLHDSVARVIAATAANRSSMLQDFRQSRTTEINDITGYLLKEAARYAIPAPHNTKIMERIESHVR